MGLDIAFLEHSIVTAYNYGLGRDLYPQIIFSLTLYFSVIYSSLSYPHRMLCLYFIIFHLNQYQIKGDPMLSLFHNISFKSIPN